MKKIFTLLVGMIISLVAYNASAMFFYSNEPDCVFLNGDALTTTPTNYSGNNFVFELKDAEFVTIKAYKPSGELESENVPHIVNEAGKIEVMMYQVVLLAGIDANDYFEIVVNKIGGGEPDPVEEPGVTVVGAKEGDIDNFKVYYGSPTALPVNDGKVGPITCEYDRYIRIATVSGSGYTIKSVTDRNGKNYVTTPSASVSIYGNELYSSKEEAAENPSILLTVALASEDDDRTSSIEVTVDGPTDTFKLLRGNSVTPVALTADGTTVVKFNPETESHFIIQPGYQKNLYKVELNGTAVSEDQGSYEIDAHNGDKLLIVSQFPEVTVTVNLTGETGAISEIEVDGTKLDRDAVIEEGKFTCKMGDEVSLRYDHEAYEVNVITINDVEQGATWSTTFTALEENYTVNIDATSNAVETKLVTISATNYEYVRVYANAVAEENLLTLTATTTELELAADVTTLEIVAAEGYILDSVKLNGTELLTEKVQTATVENVENGDGILIDNVVSTPTGINAIGSESVDEEVILNLQGIRVNSNVRELPAGLYIVNGKKVVK